MESLTRREHWDAVHAFEKTEVRPARTVPSRGPKRWLKRLLGERFLDYMSSYDDHQIWRVMYPRYMPPKGASVVEIGSAPGDHLVRLSETFGLVPYGIEYSQEGVEVNRARFAERGLDPQNVLAMDFFSDECASLNRERFDVVISRGFIEHFEDPSVAVDRHLDLLKPGGLLVVTIPNLHGVNRALTGLFNPELIPMHNLKIMSKAPFLELFDTSRVEPRVCAYVGTFSFYLFHAKEGALLSPLLRACMKGQVLLNVLFRTVFGDRGAENRFTSPQLVFIGVKR